MKVLAPETHSGLNQQFETNIGIYYVHIYIYM